MAKKKKKVGSVEKENNHHQPRIPVKLSFKSGGEIKTFQKNKTWGNQVFSYVWLI